MAQSGEPIKEVVGGMGSELAGLHMKGPLTGQ